MCVTWNVQGYVPDSYKQLIGLFTPLLVSRPHLIAVGLQEVFECKPHNVSKIVTASASSEEHSNFRKLIEVCVKKMDPTYRSIGTEVIGPLFLCVLTRLPKDTCTDVKFSKMNLGRLGVPTKGCIAFNAILKGTKVQILNCHLESGESQAKNATRIEQIHAVLPQVFEATHPGIDTRKKVLPDNPV